MQLLPAVPHISTDTKPACAPGSTCSMGPQQCWASSDPRQTLGNTSELQRPHGGAQALHSTCRQSCGTKRSGTEHRKPSSVRCKALSWEEEETELFLVMAQDGVISYKVGPLELSPLEQNSNELLRDLVLGKSQC